MNHPPSLGSNFSHFLHTCYPTRSKPCLPLRLTSTPPQAALVHAASAPARPAPGLRTLLYPRRAEAGWGSESDAEVWPTYRTAPPPHYTPRGPQGHSRGRRRRPRVRVKRSPCAPAGPLAPARRPPLPVFTRTSLLLPVTPSFFSAPGFLAAHPWSWKAFPASSPLQGHLPRAASLPPPLGSWRPGRAGTELWRCPWEGPVLALSSVARPLPLVPWPLHPPPSWVCSS